jgi:hypothetical protein
MCVSSRKFVAGGFPSIGFDFLDGPQLSSLYLPTILQQTTSLCKQITLFKYAGKARRGLGPLQPLGDAMQMAAASRAFSNN